MEILKLRKIQIRKSGFEDAIFVMVVLFTIAIFLLILLKAWTSMRTPLEEGIESAMPSGSDVNITKTFDMVTATTILASNLLPLVLIGLFAFVFIGTAIYFNHPMMIIVGIIILGVAIMLGAIYANMYHQISSSDEFTSTNAQLPLQEKFMKYLPYIIFLIFIATILAVIYLRQGSGGTGL